MRTDCTSCGAEFEAPSREDRQAIEGYTKVETWPTTSTCAACTDLGQAPPACIQMGCGEKLRGNSDGAFSCEACASELPVEHVRELLFGRAVARIVKAAVRGDAGAAELTALVLRAARELGVLRG